MPGYDPKEDGCRYSPSCLTCPLPQCKHDMGQGGLARYLKGKAKQERVATIYREDLTAEEAAERFGITVRTVYRMLVRAREVGG